MVRDDPETRRLVDRWVRAFRDLGVVPYHQPPPTVDDYNDITRACWSTWDGSTLSPAAIPPTEDNESKRGKLTPGRDFRAKEELNGQGNRSHPYSSVRDHQRKRRTDLHQPVDVDA